jgi:hypothetical protein
MNELRMWVRSIEDKISRDANGRKRERRKGVKRGAYPHRGVKGAARVGAFWRTARGFTTRFIRGLVIRKTAAIIALAFGFQMSP